jgi:hypothetical protein
MKGQAVTPEVTDTRHEAEHTAAERYNQLIDAVHRGCEGLDSWAAQCILAAVVPVLREQIARDIEAEAPEYGGGGLPSFVGTVMRQAAQIARMGAR